MTNSKCDCSDNDSCQSLSAQLASNISTIRTIRKVPATFAEPPLYAAVVQQGNFSTVNLTTSVRIRTPQCCSVLPLLLLTHALTEQYSSAIPIAFSKSCRSPWISFMSEYSSGHVRNSSRGRAPNFIRRNRSSGRARWLPQTHQNLP